MALELLEPGHLYHIYNHALGKENLFLSDDNYQYFLRRYQHFIDPVSHTYAYCLMPNHIHFFIEVKQKIELPPECKYSVEQFISKQFSNLFSSYTQVFNKQQNRIGTLFISGFRREKVDSDEYLTRIIRYIHMNPVHHGFVKDLIKWRYSSYNTICATHETFLAKEKVISWFGNLDELKNADRIFDMPTLPKSFESESKGPIY
ncbi:MAG: transposase [Cyclobacteriaceae bacterium]